MNKNRIITSIGVVLLTTGIIGSILSGINTIPKIINNVQMAHEKFNEEEILYKSEMNLAKLDINLKTSNVTIKKYDGKNVIVQRNGNKGLSTITTKESNDKLTINEEFNNNNKNLIKSIDDIVRYFVNEIFTSSYSDITVYIPENIDVNINTDNTKVYIDDMKLNNVDFNTSYGNISLGQDSQVKNLNIKSTDIFLNVDDIYCAENINIESVGVDINGYNTISQDAKIPKNIKIKASSDYYDDINIDINTNIPIAKNLDIESNSTVSLDLPLLDYKFNFDIKTSNGIDFSDDEDKYRETVLEKYFKYYEDEGIDEDKEYKQKDFIGLINDELKDNPTEYGINIKSSIVEFD